MAVSNLQLKIIKRAIKTRLSKGENFDEIIIDYPNLSQEQVAELKEEFGIVDEVEPEPEDTEEDTEEEPTKTE